MDIVAFEKLVSRSLEELPGFFKEKLSNIIVIVKDAPDKKTEKKFGKNVLGLYEGIPVLERGAFYSGAMPDKITIFRKNIEKICSSDEEIGEEARRVVIHEIAHHFGISDEELMRKGIY